MRILKPHNALVPILSSQIQSNEDESAIKGLVYGTRSVPSFFLAKSMQMSTFMVHLGINKTPITPIKLISNDTYLISIFYKSNLPTTVK